MNVSSRRFANAVVLRVEGRLDQDTCVAFTTDLMKSVDTAAAEGGAVVLDLSGLEYISSAGLGVLLKTQKRLMASSGRLKLSGVNRHLQDIFQYSGFDQIFEIEPAE